MSKISFVGLGYTHLIHVGHSPIRSLGSPIPTLFVPVHIQYDDQVLQKGLDDAVDALIAVAEADSVAGEAFFAVGDEHYSVKDIAQKTCKIMGGSVQLIDWPKEREAIEIGDAVISNEKIKKALAWVPKVGLEDGLKLTHDYYKDKLDKYLK